MAIWLFFAVHSGGGLAWVVSFCFCAPSGIVIFRFALILLFPPPLPFPPGDSPDPVRGSAQFLNVLSYCSFFGGYLVRSLAPCSWH